MNDREPVAVHARVDQLHEPRLLLDHLHQRLHRRQRRLRIVAGGDLEEQRRALDVDRRLRLEPLERAAGQPQRARHQLIVAGVVFAQPIEHRLPDLAQRAPLEFGVDEVRRLLQLERSERLGRLDHLVRDVAAGRDQHDQHLRPSSGTKSRCSKVASVAGIIAKPT